MVIIFSESNDQTTFTELEWLDVRGINYVVIYPESEFSLLKVVINNGEVDFSFLIDKKEFSFSDISCLWYRRGTLPYFGPKYSDFLENFDIKIYEGIQKSLNYEYLTLRKFIIYKFNTLPKINSLGQGMVNKLIMLDIAREVGFKVPKTIITEDFDKVEDYYVTDELITKAMHRNFHFINKGYSYHHGTIPIRKSKLENEAKCWHSFFQNKVDKLFEIRVFHFLGKNFAMAIFSQRNEKTKVDFRNYDWDHPNRNIPFNLPKEVEFKINFFMEKAGLNCGSLDIIYTKKKEYVFLEVNPVGQWTVLTTKCNYNIHELIAKKLKEYCDAKKDKRNDEYSSTLQISRRGEAVL
ncbi:MAG: grasp-with-spasm system ATP-grasp peptide maturase [Bacteroidota bacterium]